jgi:hypothetical protein
VLFTNLFGTKIPGRLKRYGPVSFGESIGAAARRVKEKDAVVRDILAVIVEEINLPD